MKAKEYYAKFESGLLTEADAYKKWVSESKDPKEFNFLITYRLFQEMSVEAKQMVEDRHVRKGEGVMAVIREMNGRWNAMCTLFEKKHGFSPIQRNAFLAIWSKRLTEQAEKKLAELMDAQAKNQEEINNDVV